MIKIKTFGIMSSIPCRCNLLYVMFDSDSTNCFKYIFLCNFLLFSLFVKGYEKVMKTGAGVSFLTSANNSTLSLSSSSPSLSNSVKQRAPSVWPYNVAWTSGTHLNQEGFQGHDGQSGELSPARPSKPNITQYHYTCYCIGADSCNVTSLLASALVFQTFSLFHFTVL